jgi:predicted AAA+ superfamily ATPase
LAGLVIIDEIQRVPELFPVLRVLVDRPGQSTRFLILGSASRDLIRQSSETLAGRIGCYIELTPFQLGEVGLTAWSSLWFSQQKLRSRKSRMLGNSRRSFTGADNPQFPAAPR